MDTETGATWPRTKEHPEPPDTEEGKVGSSDFIFLGSKITEDGDGSHEIKRYLLFERKAVTNLVY